MKFTDEQLKVIESSSDCVISAVAGSGKTATLIGYAVAHPSDRILFLSFNRSTAMEAREKFKRRGCHNVRVETVHSLAFRDMGIGRRRNGLIDGGTLSLQDIVEMCDLDPQQGIKSLVLARHIASFLSGYCNSSVRRIDEYNYLATIKDEQSRATASSIFIDIFDKAYELFAKMYRGDLCVSHDVYLKIYQLKNPILPFDTILLDEAQDSSPVTLAIFLAQEHVTKLAVGDKCQQIYGFRNAINALDQLDFEQFYLPHSFRFNQDIADLAMESLRLKRHIGETNFPQIFGVGPGERSGTHAILARTNIGLLDSAIETMDSENDFTMFFEGNVSSYVFMSEGASLYDILSLSMSQRYKVRSQVVKRFVDIESLEEYVKASGDQEMGTGVKLVKKYGKSLFDLLNGISGRQCRSRELADLTFSTLHKSKGQQYDFVDLADGFITEHAILDSLSRNRKKGIVSDFQEIAEEVNALYVAITRTKFKINHDFNIGKFSATKG